MGEHLETVRGPQSWVFSVEQELPIFGQRGLAAEVAGHEARAEEASVEAFELALAAEVRRRAVEIRYLDLAIGMRGADVEFVHRMRDAARIQYETGSGRLTALAEVELAVAAAERELLLLHGEREVAVAEMNRLLGRPAGDRVAAACRVRSPIRLPPGRRIPWPHCRRTRSPPAARRSGRQPPASRRAPQPAISPDARTLRISCWASST